MIQIGSIRFDPISSGRSVIKIDINRSPYDVSEVSEIIDDREMFQYLWDGMDGVRLNLVSQPPKIAPAPGKSGNHRPVEHLASFVFANRCAETISATSGSDSGS